ncbi:tensin-4-like [Pristis pectinata]|uniref:tensin-4-like n=1 Tax=Pristis pectinata TaxID=685728 RepID=UPI00223D285E|nr:tensin-4-like [Pristis pectinata]
MKGTSGHSTHLDRGQGGCLFPHMETVVLNGTSLGHGQERAVCPGRVSDSRVDSFSPSMQWVCREISVQPTPSCQTQERSHPGLSRSQTVLEKSVGSQKPPLHDRIRRVNTTRAMAQQGSAACPERGKPFEQTWRNTPPLKANCAESEPLSPSLDETIENLNNLILELDPSFQPINSCTKRSYLSSSSKRQQDGPSDDPLLDAHGPGILIYDEWDSRTLHNGSTSLNSKCEPDSPGLRLQSTAISSTTPFYRLPETTEYNVFAAGHTDYPSLLHHTYTSTASSTPQFRASSPDSRIAETLSNSSTWVAVPSSRQTQGSLCLAADSSSPQQSSQPIPVPSPSNYAGSVTNSLPHQHSNLLPLMPLQREAPGSYLSTSAGSDNLSGQGQQRRLGDSVSSLLSASPGWDTLGSPHSLLSEDGEAGRIYRSAGSTYGSSGSFVNLRSPRTVPPSPCNSSFSDQQLHQTSGRAADCRTLPLPGRPAHPLHPPGARGSADGGPGLVHHGQSKRDVKKQPSSCPASAASSWSDIPLLLVNGSTQYPDQDPELQRPPSTSSGISLPRAVCPTKESSRSSSTTSLTDLPGDAEPTVKFVQDTSKYWYKPNISREQAIEMLRDKEPGSFVIRESSTYIGSFGLAMKVSSNPESPEKKTGDSSSESVRHFLIEFSRKGVCLKGCPQEPYFGSLSALVYQHCITSIGLPNKLRLPRRECLKDTGEGSSSEWAAGKTSPPKNQRADCSVVYLMSVTMESLTGPQAVLKAASFVLEQEPLPETTTVQFKVTEQGITLTDSKRKFFFRRHYQASSISHCGLDPLQRKWRKDNEPSRMFAFVAKKQGSSLENVCHVFAELERDNSAHLIIGLVTRAILEPQRR